MERKILVITSGRDSHVEMVQNYFENKMMIFDPSLFPFQTDITYKWDEGQFKIISQGKCLNDAEVIWYRKPTFLKAKDFPVPEEYKLYACSSYEQSIKSIYTLLSDKFWVSDVWSILKIGRNKLHQAEVAHKFGMLIPKTLVTSVPTIAQRFLDNHKTIVTKPLGDISLSSTKKVFLTTRIRADNQVDFDGLRLAPAIFQEEIDKVFDVRVTVVGEKVFPCEIHQRGEMTGEVDWRLGTYTNNLIYKIHNDFPESLRVKCINMIKHLGLRFGAFDFVLDHSMNYWFLEVNPNGQWAFIERETGIPISKAIADLFKSA